MNRTDVSCIARQILNNWTTKEALDIFLKNLHRAVLIYYYYLSLNVNHHLKDGEDVGRSGESIAAECQNHHESST